MTSVSITQLSSDMRAKASLLARETGFIAQAQDRPPDANDLLFYLDGTSMPMADFLRSHGLFTDENGLNYDLAQFAAIRDMAEKVVAEREAGNRDGVWQRFDLSTDEDVDTNGTYILLVLAALECLYSPAA